MTHESFYNTFHYNEMYITVEVHTRLFYNFTHHFTILGTEKDKKFTIKSNGIFLLLLKCFPPKLKSFNVSSVLGRIFMRAYAFILPMHSTVLF